MTVAELRWVEVQKIHPARDEVKRICDDRAARCDELTRVTIKCRAVRLSKVNQGNTLSDHLQKARFQQNGRSFMSDSAELAALKVKVGHLEQQMSEMAADLKAIRETLAELRGGKKALWLLMSAAGSFGAAMTWVLQHASSK